MKKLVNEISGADISTPGDSEPDFGNYLAAGKVRKLGAEQSGKADNWFRSGGYTQTDFPQADDMWGGNFKDLTVFNLDPGIYRKSSQQMMKVPKSWANFADADEVDSPDMPNTLDRHFEKLIDDTDVKVPKYKDFF